jgi:hypothetical protein
VRSWMFRRTTRHQPWCVDRTWTDQPDRASGPAGGGRSFVDSRWALRESVDGDGATFDAIHPGAASLNLYAPNHDAAIAAESDARLPATKDNFVSSVELDSSTIQASLEGAAERLEDAEKYGCAPWGHQQHNLGAHGTPGDSSTRAHSHRMVTVDRYEWTALIPSRNAAETNSAVACGARGGPGWNGWI